MNWLILGIIILWRVVSNYIVYVVYKISNCACLREKTNENLILGFITANFKGYILMGRGGGYFTHRFDNNKPRGQTGLLDYCGPAPKRHKYKVYMILFDPSIIYLVFWWKLARVISLLRFM